MGRFAHEAVAQDLGTGIIYETEDVGDGVLYRFVPSDRQNLAAGGSLQAMRIVTARNTAQFNRRPAATTREAVNPTTSASVRAAASRCAPATS